MKNELNYYTFPNQKVVIINKPNYENNYLSIGNDEWVDASKKLSPNSFKLYLYLASNKDGYKMALSKQAVMNLLDISKDSYIRGVKDLIEHQYLVNIKGNNYNFFTTPIKATLQPSCMQESIDNICKNDTIIYAPTPIEINNITIKNNLNSVANAKEERKRILEDLDDEELINLNEDYKKRIPFPELCTKYNIEPKAKDGRYTLTINLSKDIDAILKKRKASRTKQQSQNKLNSTYKKLGLTADQCNQLSNELFNLDWESISWHDDDLYSTSFFGTGMTIKELYDYLQKNPLASKETFEQYSKIINFKEKKHKEYFDYLQDYIHNTDTVVKLVNKTMIENKSLS